ncbi:hypothetical protein DYBT9623_01719 [Dyadobacter sp. CECT 9623]|uniref:Uncharacterized protein n=1 Tax=Dyadobacter linearis TaxID=2823330 RepID=A0ABM8UNF9_9BACT|nr:gliding motility-associated C-terminal domain-containing protein [Dyadobacter sp. CECT 9623]CAG5068985.1 hypothetical protein DYBT9623_01719 [Dyadobacter sp. CECT 9623]
MKFQAFLLLASLVCISQNCTSQESPEAISKEYESCCGTQPVEYTLDKKHVYVPNVFSPNKDGVNDFFQPFINDVITDVWGFSIYSAEGDTMFYQKPYFNSKMNVKEYGWDGLRPDGSRYKGAFKYKMGITLL